MSARWRELEALVDATPGADPWCSGPDWVVPVHDAFAADSEPLVITGAAGAALLARYRSDGGAVYLAGLEPLWGFACPLLGPEPAAVAAMTVEALSAIRGWRVLVLTGLPESRSFLTAISTELAGLGPVRGHLGIERQVADLTGGFDPWFGRRSARFRKTMRAIEREASAVGITLTDISRDADVFERCLRIEHRSWKGQVGDGITTGAMHHFYRELVARLGQRGRLEATIASVDGRDVGYILGGIRAGRYRGLQLSYTEDAAELSVSHLLQLHTVRGLTERGGIDVYDMGMDMAYKQRWADRAERSITLVVERTSR